MKEVADVTRSSDPSESPVGRTAERLLAILFLAEPLRLHRLPVGLMVLTREPVRMVTSSILAVATNQWHGLTATET